MKTKLILFTLFLYFSTIFSYGQIQDLSKLAEGKIVYQKTLFDTNDKIYGYLYIYERDKNEQTKTMEYVFLDKNLNKVSNKEFESKLYEKVKSFFYSSTLMGDYIILDKYYYYNSFFTGSNPLLSTFQIISLKENTVSPEYKFENDSFVEFVAQFDKMKSDYKNQEFRDIIYGFNNGAFKGFYIIQDYPKKSWLEKSFTFFNEKHEKIWNFEYNPSGTKDDYSTFRFIEVSKNTMFLAISKWHTDFETALSIIEYKIVALDILTGKKKYEFVFENKKSEYSHTVSAKEINEKLYLTGNYSAYKSTDFSLDQNLGFYKVVLDENGNKIESSYTKWEDFSPFIKVDKRGRVESNYRLRPVKNFVFKDGSVSFLNIKYKYDPYWTGAAKMTDFVLFNMKPDFKIDTVNIIKKELSYYSSEYLFSQYIKNDSAAVFFFYDIKKDPGESLYDSNNMMLGINTIQNRRLTEEKIPISAKKKYFISPRPAKEGYIMLQEYNEKDKYNQIRLEKLNF